MGRFGWESRKGLVSFNRIQKGLRRFSGFGGRGRELELELRSRVTPGGDL